MGFNFLKFGNKAKDAPKVNTNEAEVTISNTPQSPSLMERLKGVQEGGHTFNSDVAKEVGLTPGDQVPVRNSPGITEAEVTIKKPDEAATE